MARQLSKSDFLLFMKHPAWLWLKKFEPSKLPPIDAATQARFDAGNKFERFAEQIFTDGVRIEGDYFERDRATSRELASGTKTLFQAKFTAPDNTACLSDVLVRVDGSTFDLYEIKTSTKPRAEHAWDLAFQKHVIESCGYTIRKTSVVHVNASYVRQGEVVLDQLVTISDVTAEVKAVERNIKPKIAAAMEVIASPECPDISPRYASFSGLFDWLPLYKKLRLDVPADSIYNVARLTPEFVTALEDSGATSMRDIPLEILSKLPPAAQMQVAAFKAGKPLVKTEQINKFLQKLVFPLYFLDYETASDVVPLYDGTRPYQQVAMQYSAHILDAPDAPLRQAEFLARTTDNPMPELIEHLKADIGPVGSIVVWYKNFECGRHSEMAELYPEHAEFLLDLNHRTVDLMDPFAKQYYVDAGFGGSASIKKVLPVLAPDLSYQELAIQDGGNAQGSWMQAVFGEVADGEREQVFANLIEYCRLDTLAMVRIYEFLQELVGTPDAQPSLF